MEPRARSRALSLWNVERSESLPSALARSALQFTCMRKYPRPLLALFYLCANPDFLHLTDEAQRGKVPQPRPHSWQVGELGCQSRQPGAVPIPKPFGCFSPASPTPRDRPVVLFIIRSHKVILGLSRGIHSLSPAGAKAVSSRTTFPIPPCCCLAQSVSLPCLNFHLSQVENRKPFRFNSGSCASPVPRLL